MCQILSHVTHSAVFPGATPPVSFSLSSSTSTFPPVYHLYTWHICLLLLSSSYFWCLSYSHWMIYHLREICSCQLWGVITRRHFRFDYRHYFNHTVGTAVVNSDFSATSRQGRAWTCSSLISTAL